MAIGPELAVGHVSVVPTTQGFGKKLESEAGAEVDSAGKALGDRTGKGLLGGLGGHLGGVAALVGGAFAAVKIAGFLGDAIGEAREAAKEMRLTEQVIKTTGGAAGLTADQMSDLAGKLALVSGVDDDVILSGERVLATFTGIKNAAGANNDVFTQASSIALDMSTALGSDLQGSIIQVGKALNDPIKGVTALSKVGVSFTQQQKDQIKTLVASGDVLSAQKVILKELNVEFGGAAKAAADPIAQFAFLRGEITEAIGAAILPFVNALGKLMLPVLLKTADVINDVVAPALQTVVDTIGKKMSKAVGIGRTSLKSFELMVRSVGGITNLSFGRVIDEAGHSLQAFAAAFRSTGHDITSSGFNAEMEKFGLTVRDFVQRNNLGGVADVFKSIIDLAQGFVLGLSGQGELIGTVMQDTWVGKFILAGDIIRDVFDSIGDVLGAFRDSTVSLFGTVRDAVGDWFSPFTEAGGVLEKSGVLGFFDNLKTKIQDVIDAHPEVVPGLLAAAGIGAGTGATVIGGSLAAAGVATTVEGVSKAVAPAARALDGLLNLAANTIGLVAALLVAPIGLAATLIVAAVVAVGAAFVIAYLKIKPFHDAVDAVARVIADTAVAAFEALKTAIPAAMAAIVRFGQSVADAVGGPISAVVSTLTEFANGVASVAVAVFNALAPVGVFVRDDLFPTFFAFGELIVAIAQRAIQAFNAFAESAVAAVKLIGDTVSFLIDNFIRPLVSAITPVLMGLVKIIQGVFKIILPIITGALKIIVTSITTAFSIVVTIIETALGIIRGIIQVLTGIISGDWDKVWEGLRTIVESVFEGIRDIIFTVISSIVDKLRIVFETIKGVIGGILSGVPDILRGVLDILVAIFSGAGPRLIRGLIDGISSAVGFLSSLLPGLFPGAGKAIIDGLIAGLNLALEGLSAFFTDLLPLVLGWLGDAALWLLDKGVDVITGLVTGLWNALPGIAAFIGDLLPKVLAWIGQTELWLLQKGWDLLTGIVTGLANKLPDLAAWFFGLPPQVQGWLGDASSWLVDKGREIITGLLSGILNKAIDLGTFFGGLAGRIAGYIGSAVTWLLQIGRDVIQGLINGISEKLGALRDKAGEVGGIVKGAIGNILHFGSPSKVTTQYGEWLVEGFILGIDNRTAQLKDAVTGVFKLAGEGAKAAIGDILTSIDFGQVSSDTWDKMIRAGWTVAGEGNKSKLFAPTGQSIQINAPGAAPGPTHAIAPASSSGAWRPINLTVYGNDASPQDMISALEWTIKTSGRGV